MPPVRGSAYTPEEIKKLLNEVMDPTRVMLTCGQHQYIASETPPKPIGCKDCWEAYWWFKIATTPPHLRQQRLEEAYRATYDAVKAYERGEFDFEPLAHPHIEIEKDAFDEVTKTEKLKFN